MRATTEGTRGCRGGRGGGARALARSPARRAPCRGPGGSAVSWGFPAPAVCRRSGTGSAATSLLSPSVRPPVSPRARSGLRLSRARAGHRASRGTAHTRCRPPPTGSSAAATPRSLATPLGHAPPARSRPSRLPGGLHPSSQRVMTQHVVTPCFSPLPERFWVWGGVQPVPVFQPRRGVRPDYAQANSLQPDIKMD